MFARSLLLALLLPAAPLSGQASYEVPPEGGEPVSRHPEAARAIDHLWSPYCPGFMLEVCTSAQGAALRDSLQQMAVAGSSSEELVEWVVANHGEEYRALPRAEGTGLLAWLGPPLVLLLGLAVLVLALRHMLALRRATAPAGPTREPTEEEEERLRAALREMDVEEEAPLF